MFSSLRTRLWLSYALLIGVLLLVVGGGLVVVLARSAYMARVAVPRLRGAEGAAYALLEIRLLDTTERQQTVIDRVAQLYGVHIAILKQDGATLLAAGLDNSAPYPRLAQPLATNSVNLASVSSVRDVNRRIWFYTLRILDSQTNTYLMVTILRPQIAWLAILSDDIGRPLLEASLLALVAASILALLVGRWIANPLSKVTEAARRVARGDNRPIIPKGPAEVKELASSFNEMIRKVQSSQQSQRDFVANVSHELKTPLTAVQGFAQAIVDGAVNSPEMVRQAGNVILTEADRMYRLVTDLLTLARLDAGTANLTSEPVDLVDLLERTLHKFEPVAKNAQVTLNSQVDEIPIFSGDGDRLVQVFNNLVDNAIKFTPPEGKVTVSAQKTGDQIEIKVADTGIGIAPEDQKRIFERFYQADPSRHGGVGRGTGLGLAIARQIVLAEGGTLTVTSTVGKGSQFTVNLPVKNS